MTEIREFDALPEEAAYIRSEVFVREQGFAGEFDFTDGIARHLVLYEDGRPAAVCRYYREDGGSYRIGRIAVLQPYRGRNLGAAVVRAAEARIRAAGGREIRIGAQVRVKGFYERLGYETAGQEYLDENCPHVPMRKTLTKKTALPSAKTFCFTVDDNIRFLAELSAGKCRSLFDHPYPALYRDLHRRYGLKVQLNLFYETDGFDLSGMTDRYRGEWADNADWLKLSFHSRRENANPYEKAGYGEVYGDCTAVQREIRRFAGRASEGRTTTVHCCRTTPAGTRALGDAGVEGLLGLFGTPDAPRTSYALTGSDADTVRSGTPVFRDGIKYFPIDIVLNLFPPDEIARRLDGLAARRHINVMIHEQYFYPDYFAYQPDFKTKLETAFGFFARHGYESRFLEECL